MADLHKFNQLLKLNDYTVLEYFSFNHYCNLVKVIHILTGRIYFIHVARTYRLSITEDVSNHYILSKEDAKSKEFTSSQMTEHYPMINIQAQSEQVVDNISDKLKTSYKQPITLHTTSASDQIEQIKRLRYCFKMLEYKIILQTDQYIIHLTQENTLIVYKIENYPQTHTNTFYVVVTLEQFYSNLNNMHTTVDQIEKEFFSILNLNQIKHNQYLNTSQVHYFMNNNQQLLETKKTLHDTYQEICEMLLKIQQRESQCLESLNEAREAVGHNMFREADQVRKREELEANYKRIHNTKLQLLDKLLKLDTKIKNIYLVIDQLGFNLSLAFNELRSELYKMLL
jgi:hypothetical protein